MKEGVMGAEMLFARPAEREVEREEETRAGEMRARHATRWDPDTYAREQIQGLVRRVFFANAERKVRQVVLSAVDSETEVKSVCRKIGKALAAETEGTIAVVGDWLHEVRDVELPAAVAKDRDFRPPLRQGATQFGSNLWSVPPRRSEGNRVTTASLHSFLSELRSGFDYSIVAAAPAGESNEAAAMAQFADGIILVVSAHRTRRILARKVKDMLEGARARVLGVVLSERDFPMPEGIYRRL